MLEKYKTVRSRYECPLCKEMYFTRYVNTHTGEYVHPTVGKCSRLNKCGYHYPPRQYFKDNNIALQKDSNYKFSVIQYAQNFTSKESYIPLDDLKSSLKNISANGFILFLERYFGVAITNALTSSYYIGTSDKWNGSTVFWQIDINGKIRTGEILLFDYKSGKSIKKPFRHKDWIHTHLKLKDFQLKQCFFAEHLLSGNNKPIAIVESAKTAIIASVYYPEYVWLASMGLTGLNIEKCKVLKGRRVTLFPDLKGYDAWKKKQYQISHQIPTIQFTDISDILENIATDDERKEALDLADYLLKLNYREFIINSK